MHRVFVVSDGTGRTAEQALKAALTQFPDADVTVVRRPEVRNEAHIRAVVQEAADVDGLIIHTLVSDTLREVLIRASRTHNIEVIDLMGPLLVRLSEHLAHSPSETPGLFRKLNESYFRRIESTEFALRHDDGQRLHDLLQAEIVLLGVSRTFKTPLSIYLAQKGWFVANIPIVLGMELPPILYELAPERVFGLVTNARKLSALRKRRQERLHGAPGPYANLDHVHRELTYALHLFGKQPAWATIDVTNKPIEEIASEILALRRHHASVKQ